MKKKYYKPYFRARKMNFILLEEVSNVHVGGYGRLESKKFSSYYYDDFYDEEE
jgi:hypothetical protein